MDQVGQCDLDDHLKRHRLSRRQLLRRQLPVRARPAHGQRALDVADARRQHQVAESDTRQWRAVRRRRHEAQPLRSRRFDQHPYDLAGGRPRRPHRALDAADRRRRRDGQLHGDCRCRLRAPHRGRLRRHARRRHVHDRGGHGRLLGRRDLRASHAHRHANRRRERQHRAVDAADRQRRQHRRLHADAGCALPRRRRQRLRRLAQRQHVHDRPDHRRLHGQRDVRNLHAPRHARRRRRHRRHDRARRRRRPSTTATRRASRSRRRRTMRSPTSAAAAARSSATPTRPARSAPTAR